MLGNPLAETAKKDYRPYSTTLPTADKSPYADRTDTYYGTPGKVLFQSSDRLSQKKSKISQAKSQINDIIDTVTQKATNNRQALQEVKNVNLQIISSFTCYNPDKNYHEADRFWNSENRNRSDYHDNVVTSAFDWKPARETELPSFEAPINRSNTADQNNQLHSLLNESIRKNNDLIKKINFFESENNRLQSQMMNRGSSNANLDKLRLENQQLQWKLSNLSVNDDASYLLAEMERLKEENQQLRKDTITLLKSR